jgi:hypothetical protein
MQQCLSCRATTLVRHEFDEEEGDCSAWEEHGLLCYSTHDDGETMLICATCKAIHVLCLTCQEPCRFLGHAGCFRTTENGAGRMSCYRGPRPAHVPCVYGDADEREKLERRIAHADHTEFLEHDAVARWAADGAAAVAYYVGDRDLRVATTRDVLLTGPDGGHVHGWRCDECQETYLISDK